MAIRMKNFNSGMIGGRKRLRKVLLPSIAILLLVAVVFSPLSRAQSEAVGPQLNTGMQAQPDKPPNVAIATPGLQSQSFAETSSGDNGVVFNGDFITYTFIITNPGALVATNVKVFDAMPPDTFSQVECLGPVICGRQLVTLFIANPLGGFIEVTKTSLLTWTVASLAMNEAASFTFRARVAGKSDGTVFYNNIFVSYDQGNPFQGQIITSTVRQRLAANGGAGLPSIPTWFSTDSGGTLDQAWGDYDRDGTMDLALASSVGTTIYHNDNGKLKAVLQNQVQSYGVAWADVDGDGLLELVAVGDSNDKTSLTPGKNYVYHLVPATGKFVVYSTFQSPLQFAHLAMADLTGTGRVDLIGSTNAINVQGLTNCAVYMVHNDGSGKFSDLSQWQCITETATAAIALGDFRNTGIPDLVLGQFPNGIVELRNTRYFTAPATPITSAVLGFSNPVPIDTSITFLPYGFSVGDYDSDGNLDLAAAYPLQREARVYRNNAGNGFAVSATIRTNVFWTPLAVDWGDFTGSGKLDLLVGDLPPKIYHYTPANGRFTLLGQLAVGAVAGQVWDIRGVQTHPYQDLAVALANRDQASMIFDGAIPHIARTLTPVDPKGNPQYAGSVALGDTTGSGMLDVLYGSAFGNIGSRLYFNDGSAFPSFSVPNPSAVLGPEHVALADIAGNGKLQLAIGSAVDVRIYNVFDGSAQPQIISIPDGGPYVVAWGDINGDGLLDLLVGSNGHIYTYLNVGGTIASSPLWTSLETCNITSLAWSDYNHSHWLSFAAGCKDAPVRLYENSTRNSFNLVWSAPYISNTSSIAWADYDASGYQSLAVGNKGEPSVIYENNAGTLGSEPVWSTSTSSQTTSIAWGDWNNDGYPELALGNQGEPVQVFANMSSKPGQPGLAWTWSSNEATQVTGVAWGDVTNSGYQSLVVSSADEGGNGIYKNGSALPSQFSSIFTPTLPLPHVAPYVTMKRPGKTDGAFLYSSAELLGSTKSPTVTVQYTVFGPDSTRDASKDLSVSTPISKVLFEYSLDGGAIWKTATADISSPLPVTQALRTGTPASFVWNPVSDKAISEDARFRITVIKPDLVGAAQQDAGSAISPPFRVRATTCEWPALPRFVYSPSSPTNMQNVSFFGSVGYGSGPITITWNFGDGSAPVRGQNAVHSFTALLTTTMNVKMLVEGKPCPVTRPVFTTTQILVGNPINIRAHVYMPMVAQGAVLLRSASNESMVTQQADAVVETTSVDSTSVVSDLNGEVSSETGLTRLTWMGIGSNGYRVYRGSRDIAGSYELIAELGVEATSYDDPGAVCGYSYYVTSTSDQGLESAPSMNSYYSPSCSQ